MAYLWRDVMSRKEEAEGMVPEEQFRLLKDDGPDWFPMSIHLGRGVPKY